MSKIDNVKRLTVETFQEDHQDTVSKIAQIYNYFVEQVTNTINGKIQIDNLDRQIIEITLSVDSTGKPIGNNKFASESGLRGSKIVRVINTTSRGKYVSQCPFLTFSPTDLPTVYTIENVAGLAPNDKYQLLIELIP